MTRPEPMELVCNTNAWTAGTRGPSRGPLLRAPGDEAALQAMKGRLANVWLLDPPRALSRQLEAALEEEGGFGFVVGGSELLITGGRPNVRMDDLPRLPTVRLRRDCHAALVQRLESGAEVEVEFDIRNHFRAGPIPLYNVIADIVGTEQPDQYVVVGGHVDSWDGATGTTDNGTGTATTLEAARILMAIGAKPRRTIRFMLWSGEEQGLLGSRAWVRRDPRVPAALVGRDRDRRARARQPARAGDAREHAGAALARGYQGNSGCGGALAGASSGGSVGSPRCSRIRWIASGSKIAASSVRAPPHQGHVSTSRRNTRRSSSAHEYRLRGRCGLAGACGRTASWVRRHLRPATARRLASWLRPASRGATFAPGGGGSLPGRPDRAAAAAARRGGGSRRRAPARRGR
jgi:hypothetical protein